MLILRGEIAKRQSKRKINQLEKDLNSILKKWKWGNKPFQNSQDFLNKMAPWVDKQIEKDKEWEEFMKKWGIKNLDQIKGIELKGEGE